MVLRLDLGDFHVGDVGEGDDSADGGDDGEREDDGVFAEDSLRGFLVA